jgi:hypothetical protein
VAFLTATSLIAMVPLSEFRTPTLMPLAPLLATVGAAALTAAAAVGAAAGVGALQAANSPAAEPASTTPVDTRKNERRFRFRFSIAQHYRPPQTSTSALVLRTAGLPLFHVPNDSVLRT